MEDFFDRLDVALSEQSRKFADLKGVLPHSTFYRWKRREGGPSERAVADVANLLGVSAQWLMTGEAQQEAMVGAVQPLKIRRPEPVPAMRMREDAARPSGATRGDDHSRLTLESLVRELSGEEVSDLILRLLARAERGDGTAARAARDLLELRKLLGGG